MAITVDYTLTPFRVTIPKSDLTLESGTKYKLTVDTYWNLLSDYSDSPESLPHPLMYSRIPATSSTPSITEIDGTYYDLVFEDGLYSVNIIEGNTNIREVEVKNQVSVNTNNTTGFIDPTYLQFATFNGGVWVDVINGTTGTTYPMGTPSSKVDNFLEALVIAGSDFDTLFINGDAVVDSSQDFSDYKLVGQGVNLSNFTLHADATFIDSTFSQATITGTLDGDAHIYDCIINGLNFVSGVIDSCILNSATITLGGNQVAHFVNCMSGVPGVGTPTIDMGGSGQALALRNYNGGVKLQNKTGTDSVSIDLNSGHVILDSTVTNGEIIVRGVGKLTDNSNGATVRAELVSGLDVQDIHGQVQREVWIDSSLASNGNGYQQSPYNNITDAVDDAEASGITTLVVLDDITLDRDLKNMAVRGVGTPVIDLAGYDLKGSEFHRVRLEGVYTSPIIVQESVLLTGMWLNGHFENCALAGDLFCVDAGDVYMKNSASAIAGLSRPTISMNGIGSSKMSVRGHGGGLTIKDCNNVLDEVTVEMGLGGSLTFDSSCTAGTMVARTTGKFVDETNGATVVDEAYVQAIDKHTDLDLKLTY